MICYICQPNRQWLEIEIDPKQSGEVLLDKALRELGIIEVDFFGLQFTGPKREELWINLRNKISDQLHHFITGCHLNLRVKYFVQPHLVQQEKTKELFYTQAKHEMSQGHIRAGDEDTMARLVAAITQAENGDQTDNFYQRNTYRDIVNEICPSFHVTTGFIDKTHSEHSKMRDFPKSSARYFVLKELASLPGYGEEIHKVQTVHGADMIISVGPDGIALRGVDCERKIPYMQVRLATHKEKSVHLKLLDDFGEEVEEETYKLISKRAAIALYRCITEMYFFYRCDTVCSLVHSQFSRDLKGTFFSMFTDKTQLGKRYLFDIKRTSQEAYDHVRRQLFSNRNQLCYTDNCEPPNETENDNEAVNLDNEESGEENKQIQTEYKKLKRRLEQVEDSLLCCICMDEQVSVVLCPCGHMTCDVCAYKITDCPQCRTEIERFQKVFQNFFGCATKVPKDGPQFV